METSSVIATAYIVLVADWISLALAWATYSQCGQLVDMATASISAGALWFRLHGDSCDVTIRTRQGERILFRASTKATKQVHITLNHGDTHGEHDSPPTTAKHPCQWCVNVNETYTSEDNYVRVRFWTSRDRAGSNQPLDNPYLTTTIVFVSFHKGNCSEAEYRCDNGRCVSRQVSCLEYSACGVNSSCPLVQTDPRDRVSPRKTVRDVAIILACLLGAGILVIMAAVCVRHVHIRRNASFPGVSSWSSSNSRRFSMVSETELQRTVFTYAAPEYADVVPTRLPFQSLDTQNPPSDMQHCACHSDGGCETNTFSGDVSLPPPPAYDLVMSSQEDFHVSSADIRT